MKKKVGTAEQRWLYLHTVGYLNRRYKVEWTRTVVAVVVVVVAAVVVVVTAKFLSFVREAVASRQAIQDAWGQGSTSSSYT